MRQFLLALLLAATAHAQWTIQQSNTTADLRGIDNVGHGIAWASGSNGTVLHTTDNGVTWLLCKTPPDAEHLDFRGIQAFDAKRAVIMSSGKGDLSRVYRTDDVCETWSLIAKNPEAEGFWDALIKLSPIAPSNLLVIGDPVREKFPMYVVEAWPEPYLNRVMQIPAQKGEAAFAASNSSFFHINTSYGYWLITGGPLGARVIRPTVHGITDETGWTTYPSTFVALGVKTESSGGFSIQLREDAGKYVNGIAVGGDYQAPNSTDATATYTSDGGKHWFSPQILPHGYRSAVAYDAPSKTWITVGPNGTDISTDDGRNWRALKPSATDTPDADQNWNALSLPFVVGPHGRIGLLNSTALQPAKH
jgi:photosystem II stability/assembly factor-like uncharacterized protein